MSQKITPTPKDYPDPKDIRKVDWGDHGILRRVWHNFDEIAPGVYRSNQPSFERFQYLKSIGITHILNLRGDGNSPAHRVVRQSCSALGLELVPLRFSAREAPPKDTIQDMINIFRRLPKPFLMHCKSGADRTSFAAALYLIVIMGEPVDRAMRMLSIRYIHLRFTETGIMDYVLESYAARFKSSEIPFEEWLATEYDQEALQQAFNNKVPISA